MRRHKQALIHRRGAAVFCGLLTAVLLVVVTITAGAQRVQPVGVTPPALPSAMTPVRQSSTDSIPMQFPVQPTVAESYDELMKEERPADLDTPANIKTVAEYDPATGTYMVRTKVGNYDVATPFILSADQYNNWQLRQSLTNYFQERNRAQAQDNDKQPFDIFDMNFALGPLEKIFGPGGVQLKTSGSIQIKAGVNSNKTDNPSLSVTARRKTYFDFDQKIQATINASVGNRLKFNMTYNTDATFDFDSKNLKLAYEGEEDDIVKSIEAGNVSMTTGSSLIRGGTALFGVKSVLQFGKLTTTLLLSQQNSESQTVNTKGGVQTTEFTVNADQYDQNRHYFLSQYFYNNYDNFASKLPLVASGMKITRIEVWVTNKSNNYNEARNLVAFADLGEENSLNNPYWTTNPACPNPSNNSNNLLATIKADYPDARSINSVTQALEPLRAYGIEGGKDYEKVESARLLTSTEYTLNSTLGYISLKTALNSDEVLAVAFEYSYNGQVYQVGEFSSDISSTTQSLYVKMLKATTVDPKIPLWRLMMKNVYNLGAYQIQKNKFRLNIKYLSDTTGTLINYLPVPGLNNQSLLQVMNLDRLDSNEEGNPDGFFDFIEGYTIQTATGKVIFPVAEPFGSHLERKIGNPAIAKEYVYKELYDSTYVVAAQFTDKNKFVLQGEYVSSKGSQIRLNAMNVPRGSVVVYAGGVKLTENSDYTVDYTMGIVTITNQSIIDSGQNVSVTLENQSLFSMQRKTLIGLDLQYAFNKHFNIGGQFLHFSEKALTEKVNIGDEVINNTMWGANMSYNSEFMWLTNLLNKIPTVNATQPSRISVTAEYAQLIPHSQKPGSSQGSSYVDDFEDAQTGIDLRSPYSWFLASTPYDPSPDAMFPEAALSNNVDYGKNRALLNWYTIDRMFTDRNSSLCPGYIKADLKQLSNPYVREVTSREIFPGRELSYGESNIVQTLNLSFYPTERGPYNLDATNIDDQGSLLFPDRRWGGIMRKMDNANFEQSNIEYIQFWMMNPFLDPENPNYDGGDLYLNFGEISEDILKDGLKSYENGIPVDGNDQYLEQTVWGNVSKQNSLTYSFDNNSGSRPRQDVGLDGLKNDLEFGFPSYKDYLDQLTVRLSPAKLQEMYADKFSPFNDPAGDNYHFFRGYDYDEERLSVLQRYKRYNGVEGNSLSPDDVDEPLYQSSRSVPDVEDINQDNTLNEYERYFQYHVSIRPEDLVVGKNFITDKQVSLVPTRDGETTEVEWYQFKIPLSEYEKIVGSINDFSSIRFARIFMTGFRQVTHLRFATLELVRGTWRTYDFNLNNRGDAPAEGELDVSVVNIEENASREPVNYVLPPGVTRAIDPGQSQITQLNEQSLSLKVTNLDPGDARAIYRSTQTDLRNYRKLQMWVHAESLIDDVTGLQNGQLSMFIRLGSDVKNNFYEYEIPLTLTPHDKYNNNLSTDRLIVWPTNNFMDITLQHLVDLKVERNKAKNLEGSGVGFTTFFTGRDPDNENNTMAVVGNPTLSDVRVILVGVRNKAATTKAGIVWVNELKVTDFNDDGGWAAKANVNLGVSDVATFNFAGHIETAGFGAVDQSLNARRMDDYEQYSFSMQADAGRFLPEAVKLKAPIFYSVTKEKITPKYNPLDQDVLLKDALDAAANKHERDSINGYAIERTTVQNFSISGLRFDVTSDTPMPWDPSNFTGSFSFSKQAKVNPTTEYENTNDYRGSLQYNYSPYFKPFKPLGFIKTKDKNLKFFSDWELNYLPTSLSLGTNVSRYYYEQQTRSETDQFFQLPVSVSKNFIWDRQLNLTWNITKSLSLSFASNTSARIEETVGAVNRKLFPDQYKEWRDTVWSSILSLGTPWSYNQTFTGSYKAPFNRIPALDFLTGSVTYNSTYKWDRGARIEDVDMGNSIASQSSWSVDGRINFEALYKKLPYIKDVDKRFAGSGNSNRKRQPKHFERTYDLCSDTTLTIKHNLRTTKLKVVATNADGKRVPVKTRIVDANSIEVLTRQDTTLTFNIDETFKEQLPVFREIADHVTRLVMSPRNVSVRWKRTSTLSLPLFRPNIGDIFGQTTNYGPMSPGLDFAFGFAGEDYIDKALERNWLITDNGQTSPALSSLANELNIEGNFEPVKGLKIQVTMNRTDNRTSQVQFMYADQPITRTGTFTMTTMALATSLRMSNPDDGYLDANFEKFLSYIPVLRQRLERGYLGSNYPRTGFFVGNPHAGAPYDPKVGTFSETSSDVLIPAFVAAYTGRAPETVWTNPFPDFSAVLPNWRVTYDGLINYFGLRDKIKSITLSHAYQCTYSVGNYTSYLKWVGIDGSQSERGFILDEVTGQPIPSSPFNISSVVITEKFAPLIGLALTLKNDITVNAQWQDQRTLTLNSSAGQLVEATTRGITLGAGYKIIGFNKVLKMKGSQQGVSNDLTLNAEMSFQNTQALIRRMESNYTQPTSGARTFSFNFTANYVMSRKLTIGAFIDHRANTPLVTTSSYPTSNSSYGISFNLNLTR